MASATSSPAAADKSWGDADINAASSLPMALVMDKYSRGYGARVDAQANAPQR